MHAQMRLVTGFEIVNHALSMGLIASTAGVDAVAVDAGPGRRRRGRGGDRDGAAPERHLALGDVGDGGAVRAHRHGAGRHRHAVARRTRWSTRRMRSRSWSRRGEIRFENVSFGYGGKRNGDRRPVAARSGRARRSASSAARARASRRSSTCCCASTTSSSGRILIDGQDIAHVHAGEPARADRHGDAGHVAAASLGARQHRLRPAGRDRRARWSPRRERAEAHEFIDGLADPKGRARLRRARRRARRQAFRRPAPAHRDRARDAQGRADPAARRGDQRARLARSRRRSSRASTG